MKRRPMNQSKGRRQFSRTARPLRHFVNDVRYRPQRGGIVL